MYPDYIDNGTNTKKKFTQQQDKIKHCIQSDYEPFVLHGNMTDIISDTP